MAQHNLFVARWDPTTMPNVYGPASQVVLAQSPRIGVIHGPSHRLERNWGNPPKRNYHFPARWLGCPQGTTTDYIARGPGVEGPIHEIRPPISLYLLRNFKEFNKNLRVRLPIPQWVQELLCGLDWRYAFGPWTYNFPSCVPVARVAYDVGRKISGLDTRW